MYGWHDGRNVDLDRRRNFANCSACYRHREVAQAEVVATMVGELQELETPVLRRRVRECKLCG